MDADRSNAPALSSRVVLALVLVAVLAAAGLLVWAQLRYVDARDSAEADEAAMRAARAGVLAWGAVDHADVEGYIERVEQIADGEFLAQFEQSEVALRELVEENRSVQVPTVPDDGVGLFERIGDTARVLVVMDATVTNRTIEKSGEGPQQRQYRLLLTMTEAGDQWRISGLEIVDARA